MALRVWLPLNNDIENKGLSNYQFINNGAILNDNGKIGKSYLFNGTSSRISTTGVSLPDNFSISLWFCCTSVDSTSQWLFCLNNNNGTNTEIQGGVYITSSNIFHDCGGQGTYQYSITTGTWYHIVQVVDNATSYLYINGELKHSFVGTKVSCPNFTIGARSNSSSGAAASATYYFNGRINDVRIYDEALSKKQIKEISKGLIAHYTLDNYIDNLISNNIQQCSVMPEANATTVDRIVQYIGTTDSTYTNGNFYEGIVRNIWDISSETYIPTYTWSDINPQFSNLITDVSGNGNTAIQVGTLTFNNDSPRYNKSTQFNGASLINTSVGAVLASSKDFTINGWFYHTSGTNYYASAESYNTSVCLENNRFLVYSSGGSAYVGNWSATNNVWQMLTLIHDSVAKTLTLFVNGIQTAQVVTDGTIYSNNTLNIGGRQDSADYVGSISDFRIYATALSIDDIKELYQTSGLIDNNNNIYAYEFTEGE